MIAVPVRLIHLFQHKVEVLSHHFAPKFEGRRDFVGIEIAGQKGESANLLEWWQPVLQQVYLLADKFENERVIHKIAMVDKRELPASSKLFKILKVGNDQGG